MSEVRRISMCGELRVQVGEEGINMGEESVAAMRDWLYTGD